MGLLINVVVHPANIADRDGAMLVFGGVADRFPRLKQVWADGGYQGGLRAWLGEQFRIRLAIVKKPPRWVWVPADVEPPPYPKGFQVLKRRWVVDITYVPTWMGFLYLAVVLDVYSRRIVGWAMADHLRSELVIEAVEMALWRPRPS